MKRAEMLANVEDVQRGDDVRWNSKTKKAVRILHSTRDAEGRVILETAGGTRTYQRGDKVILLEPEPVKEKRWGR